MIFFNTIIEDTSPLDNRKLVSVAMRLEDLSEMWVYENKLVRTTNYKKSSIIHEDKVFIYGDKNFLALDLDSGDQLWETEVTTELTLDQWRLTEFYIQDDKLYIKPRDRKLICLNTNTGDVVWETFHGGFNAALHMLVNDDTLILASDGDLYFFDANSGEILLIKDGEPLQNFTSNVIYDDTEDLYFTTNGDAVAFKFTKPE